jgi:hypothetical protein
MVHTMPHTSECYFGPDEGIKSRISLDTGRNRARFSAREVVQSGSPSGLAHRIPPLWPIFRCTRPISLEFFSVQPDAARNGSCRSCSEASLEDRS